MDKKVQFKNQVCTHMNINAFIISSSIYYARGDG